MSPVYPCGFCVKKANLKPWHEHAGSNYQSKCLLKTSPKQNPCLPLELLLDVLPAVPCLKYRAKGCLHLHAPLNQFHFYQL